VSATDVFGCLSTDSFTLLEIDEPVAGIAHSHVQNYFFFSSAPSQFAGNNASYTWDFGDGNTSNDPNPQHAYAWSGSPVTYTVTLSISNDCGSDQTTTIVGMDPLGVASLDGNIVRVFPNPTSDVMNIVAPRSLNIATISLTDLTGRIIFMENKVQLNNAQIDVSAISAGAYVLIVEGSDYRSELPVIIQ